MRVATATRTRILTGLSLNCKHVSIGLSIIGAMVALMVIYWPFSSVAPPSSQAAADHAEAEGATTRSQASPIFPAKAGPVLEVKRDYKRLFTSSRDFLPFVRSAAAAAKNGDADAQYYLSETLAICTKAPSDPSYGIYFVNNGDRLVPAKAVSQEGAVRSEEISTEVSDRCGPLHSAIEHGENFGIASDWLAKAADGGSSAAQSTLALRALLDLGSLPEGGAFRSQIHSGDDARALLLDVAATSDPVALWNLGAAQSQFSQSYEDRLVNRLALWLVSCRSGLDCGSDALWIQLACQTVGCPRNMTGPDMIDSLAGAYRDKVESRAQTLSEALQTGSFAQFKSFRVSDIEAPSFDP